MKVKRKALARAPNQDSEEKTEKDNNGNNNNDNSNDNDNDDGIQVSFLNIKTLENSVTIIIIEPSLNN
jgi:hypothetical protein